ncbi:unnamed protein product, partial [Meganyctiphanes norvegica]
MKKQKLEKNDASSTISNKASKIEPESDASSANTALNNSGTSQDENGISREEETIETESGSNEGPVSVIGADSSETKGGSNTELDDNQEGNAAVNDNSEREEYHAVKKENDLVADNMDHKENTKENETSLSAEQENIEEKENETQQYLDDENTDSLERDIAVMTNEKPRSSLSEKVHEHNAIEEAEGSVSMLVHESMVESEAKNLVSEIENTMNVEKDNLEKNIEIAVNDNQEGNSVVNDNSKREESQSENKENDLVADNIDHKEKTKEDETSLSEEYRDSEQKENETQQCLDNENTGSLERERAIMTNEKPRSSLSEKVHKDKAIEEAEGSVSLVVVEESIGESEAKNLDSEIENTMDIEKDNEEKNMGTDVYESESLKTEPVVNIKNDPIYYENISFDLEINGQSESTVNTNCNEKEKNKKEDGTVETNNNEEENDKAEVQPQISKEGSGEDEYDEIMEGPGGKPDPVADLFDDNEETKEDNKNEKSSNATSNDDLQTNYNSS